MHCKLHELALKRVCRQTSTTTFNSHRIFELFHCALSFKFNSNILSRSNAFLFSLSFTRSFARSLTSRSTLFFISTKLKSQSNKTHCNLKFHFVSNESARGGIEAFRVLESASAYLHTVCVCMSMNNWELNISYIFYDTTNRLSKEMQSHRSNAFVTSVILVVFLRICTSATVFVWKKKMHFCQRQRQSHHKHSCVYVIIITSYRFTTKCSQVISVSGRMKGKKKQNGTLFMHFEFKL